MSDRPEDAEPEQPALSQEAEMATWADDEPDEPLSRWETPLGHLLFDVAKLSRWLVAVMAIVFGFAGVNVALESGPVRSLLAFALALLLAAVTVVLFLLVRSGRRFIFGP
jgi:magnesium-transporting ATPase (P-type)